MESKEMICIACPMGCQMTVTKDQDLPDGYDVKGNKCKRGKAYGIEEMTNPTRVLTSTVKIRNARLNRLPVATKGAIPKGKLFEAMAHINRMEVSAPIQVGQVIIKDILGTGIDVVATRNMDVVVNQDKSARKIV